MCLCITVNISQIKKNAQNVIEYKLLYIGLK